MRCLEVPGDVAFLSGLAVAVCEHAIAVGWRLFTSCPAAAAAVTVMKATKSHIDLTTLVRLFRVFFPPLEI